MSTRDERQIIRDPEFLRDLSEMCSKSKLRIIFGFQEKVFDNPRFSFVSDTLRHVSDRFTQVIITKDATSYVVAERILKKSPAQKDQVSGQFIVRNEDNEQFYIDVDKTIDYDEKIRQKASLAAPDDLNQYFYRLVLDAVTWDKQPYVEGFKMEG